MAAKYFSIKTTKPRISSNINRKQKFLSAASGIPKFEPSRKPQTLHMASIG